MSARFAELAARRTSLGELVLRRRHDPATDADVYEVKLDDEFLMSSQFTVAEEELARLGLAAAREGRLDVVVGGLGLGYTARAALEDPRVGTLTVVETLEDVIDWHRRGLLPEVAGLADDERVQLRRADFFSLVRDGRGLAEPDGAVDVVLVDIDHSPRHLLDDAHADLYTPEGLASLGAQLRSDGVFALWSDDPPDAEFEHDLRRVFEQVDTHTVTFANPFTGGESANTVYVATSPASRAER